MFKLIWSAVLGGSPATWAILGLGVVIYTGAVFGAGFYASAHMQVAANATAGVVAAKAQEKHDVQVHAVAVKTSATVKAADVIHDTKIVTIVKTIHDLEPSPPLACALSPDVAKQLNDAGAY